MKVWKAFSKSRTVRIVCFALAGILLVTSAAGLWHGFSDPGGAAIQGAGYEQRGQFDYLVYLKPNTLYGSSILPQSEKETKAEASVVFFRDIIAEARLAFSYEFNCSEPVASIDNKVVVTITAENPGMWRKEMKQLEENHRGREFRVDFPLFLGSLDKLVDDIEEDIGVASSERDFIIRAVVHTTAKTATGKIIEDEFSHEITAVLREKTLELEGDLAGSDEGHIDGVTYREEGKFDYEVYLKSNKLYGPVILRSEELPMAESARPASPLQTLGPGLVYFPEIIDNIKASFSYEFNCDRPIRERSEEVEITAIIENPDKWSKSIVLVPKTEKNGDLRSLSPWIYTT